MRHPLPGHGLLHVCGASGPAPLDLVQPFSWPQRRAVKNTRTAGVASAAHAHLAEVVVVVLALGAEHVAHGRVVRHVGGVGDEQRAADGKGEGACAARSVRLSSVPWPPQTSRSTTASSQMDLIAIPLLSASGCRAAHQARRGGWVPRGSPPRRHPERAPTARPRGTCCRRPGAWAGRPAATTATPTRR